jgi:chromosome segregation ATPase
MKDKIDELEKRIYTLETQVNGLSRFVSTVNKFMERSKNKKCFCECTVCVAIRHSSIIPADVK